MDSDVLALVRAERLIEAASLASERGDWHSASVLYERACDWSEAARQALRGGDYLRAADLAVLAPDETVIDGVVATLESRPDLARLAAGRLIDRGHERWAAPLLEASGDPRAAAHAWDRAGYPRRAAELLEREGAVGAAVHVLEAACAREPTQWGNFVLLGRLLARFGSHKAAVRTLQRVVPEAPERREALEYLIPALERLGLQRAASDAAAERTALGGSLPARHTAVDETPKPLRLFGRYDVIQETASSANARVVECIDVVRGERVAVKIFPGSNESGRGRDALLRFEREVRTMRALAHPNVVPLREFIPEGPAIILAWMAGGTLERQIVAGPLPPARAVEIAAAILSALAEAHRAGILHRDVKPSNILFDEAGGVRLNDFGVAHLGDTTVTATAGLFGTFAYMSPEQREGRPATAQSDIFSVGVVLREMLTGKRPEPGAEGLRLIALADVHPELDHRHEAILERLCAADPSMRPVDAFSARAGLLALPWPDRVDPRVKASHRGRDSDAWSNSRRLARGVDGFAVDTWTGRHVEPVALDEETLARARAFARADDPSLQLIARIDHERKTLWLEHIAAGNAACGLLSPEHRRALSAALDALHAAGYVHGHVDAQHVIITPDGVFLRFEPVSVPSSTAEDDRRALQQL